MKKGCKIVLALSMALVLAGCNVRGNSTIDEMAATVDDSNALQGVETTEDSTQANSLFSSVSSNAPEPEDVSGIDMSNGDVDIDLTDKSATIIYSEVYNMMVSPDDYVGKKIRVNGSFAMYQDETTDKKYFACIIADATACCSQGLEFSCKDKLTYPDDYPEDGGNITVEGVFETYTEGENIYCQLKDAVMTRGDK